MKNIFDYDTELKIRKSSLLPKGIYDGIELKAILICSDIEYNCNEDDGMPHTIELMFIRKDGLVFRSKHKLGIELVPEVYNG
jgi:hypothetical protein